MKIRNFIFYLLLIACSEVAAQDIYYFQSTLQDSVLNEDTVLVLDVDTLRLNGAYDYMEIAIRDTTGTPTLTAKWNYSNDTTFYPAYVTTNYNTTAVSLSLATPENNQYQFQSKAIRRLILYITGSNDATLTYEFKARKYH